MSSVPRPRSAPLASRGRPGGRALSPDDGLRQSRGPVRVRCPSLLPGLFPLRGPGELHEGRQVR